MPVSLAILGLLALAPGAGLASKAKALSLDGAWDCGEAALVFRSASELVFDDEPMRYRRVGNVLRVEEEDGPADYPFVLSGDRLEVTFPDGSILECRRARSGSARTAEVPRGGAEAPERRGATARADGGGGSAAQLQGMLCQWSGSSTSSSSYSRSIRVQFDGAGRFRYGAESSFGSGAGLAYGGGGDGGGGSYRVAGDAVHLQFDDGSRGTAQVKMRQDDGRITELVYDGDLYARQLCD